MVRTLVKTAFFALLMLGCSLPVIGQSVPTLGVMVRSNGNQGASFNVILFGTGFTTPLSINSPSGVSFSNIVVTSSTRIDARVTIDPGATTGDYSITVTTTNGISNAATFTVLPPPFITSITPSSVARSEVVTMTISGGNFAGTPVVSISQGIATGSIIVQSSNLNTIVVKFAVVSNAAFGSHDLQVSIAGALSNTIPLNVDLPPAPTLTALSVSTGVQAEGYSVTLTGTNFVLPALTAETGITFVNLHVNSSTSITVDFSIAPFANTGDYHIAVITSGGTSNALVFTVNVHPAPTLTSISPSVIVQGVGRTFTLTGTNLVPPATITAGSGITISNVFLFTTQTSIQATFAAASNAAIGTHDVTVAAPGGTAGPVSFTVSAAPTLASISPVMVERGNSVSVTLTGTNFLPDLAVSMNFGVTVTDVVVNSPTSATATIVTTSGSSLGWRNISLSESGWTGTTDVQFAVTGGTPVLSGLSPNTVVPGTSGFVTLSGSNFQPLTNVSAGCPYFDFASELFSANTTTIVGKYSIPANAPPASCSITVNAVQGSSNSMDFIIAASAPPPTLISINPPGVFSNGRFYPGSTFLVTLVGTSLSTPMTIDAGRGITVTNINLDEFTAVHATFTVDVHATPGRHNVSVTTPAGTSNAIGFAVYPSPKHEINGDAITDLVWYNTASGQSAAWLMAGQAVWQSSNLLTSGPGWTPKQIGNFNGDFNGDIVWQHSDGSTAIWLMSGLSSFSQTVVLGGGTGWSVNQIGDFDGDGKSDILWQHTDGSIAIWLMDGVSVKSGAGLLAGSAGWSVNQIGDFNGDGKDDILWQHTDGSTAIWLMDGLAVTGGAGILGAGTGWSVKLLGDFDGDGSSDILWQHTDGSTAIWLMNGLTVTGGAGILGTGTGWSVRQIGDFDADGRSDIVWQHSNGSTAIWLMNGLNVIDGTGILGAGTGWSVNQIGDFNGDAKSDILWQHTDGSVAVWLMNGLNAYSGAGLLGPGTNWNPVQ
jgi:hypothetical protein